MFDILHSGGERREFDRFKPWSSDLAILPLRRSLILLLSRPSPIAAHALLDLSEGGARALVRGCLEIGKPLDVRVVVRRLHDVIEARGAVAWTSAHAQRIGCYYLGIRFTRLAPGEARKIARFRSYLESPEFRQKQATRRVGRWADEAELQFDV